MFSHNNSDFIRDAILNNDYLPGGDGKGIFMLNSKKFDSPIQIMLIPPDGNGSPQQVLFHYIPNERNRKGDEIFLTTDGLVLKKSDTNSLEYYSYDSIYAVKKEQLFSVTIQAFEKIFPLDFNDECMSNYIHGILRDILIAKKKYS